MIDAISGAWAGLTAAKDITKALVDIKEMAAVTSKALELNGVILGVQDKLFEARTERDEQQARIRELEKKLEKLETWEQEKQRYQLYELAESTYVYRVKPDSQGSEPMHDLCPNCYEQGIKSILQSAGIKGFFYAFFCPRCRSDFRGDPIEISI